MIQLSRREEADTSPVFPLKMTHLTIVGVLFWLFLVLKNAPASWVAWGVGQALPVQMSQLSGTVWSGQSAYNVALVAGQPFRLGNVRWTLNPVTILLLNPCLQLDVDGEPVLRGNFCLGFSGFTVQAAELRGEANVIEPWIPTKVQGNVTAQINQIVLDGNRFTAVDGQVQWQGAQLHTGQHWLALGNINAQLGTADQGRIKADISSEGGPMRLDLEAVGQLAGGLAFKGTAEVSPDAPGEIEQALMFVGEKRGDNTYTVDWAL